VEERSMATNDEILAGMAQIRDEAADAPADDGSDNTSFVDDLNVDSLSVVEVASDAGPDDVGAAFEGPLPNLKTVGDAVNFISGNSD
jgi:acyl carrier protein